MALYILKQKHREVKIPSVFLWQKTLSMTDTSTPWQKLKKNLLFILQLAAVLLICFAISGPVLKSGKVYNEITVIIDSSASMNAEEGGESRFEKAVKKAEETADGLGTGRKMSVIFAGETVIPAVTHSDNKIEIKKALESYKCGYGGSDIDNAMLLAESMNESSENVMTVIYTDFDINTGENNTLKVVNLAESNENIALTGISCGAGTDSFTVLSTLVNYGEDKEISLELYCDGILTDAKRVSAEKGVRCSVYWKNIDKSYSVATVKTAEKDILGDDNEISIALTADEKRKVVIVSAQSFFIEKIFSATGGFDVYKINPDDYGEKNEGDYDLYVFDGFVPEKIPENGGIWFINPKSDAEGIKYVSTIKGTSLSGAATPEASEIGEYVNFPEIILSKFSEITLSDDWSSVANCGYYPAIAVKSSEGGRRFALFSFDLHDSNLPLLKEYPIIMQNLISFTCPKMTDGNGLCLAETIPEIRALAYSSAVSVITPQGKKVELAPPFPVSSFRLDTPGLYEIIQKISKKNGEEEQTYEIRGYISAVIPESESAMKGSASADENAGKKENNILKGQTEIWPYIIIAVLLLMMAEWAVYYREY